MAFYTELYKTNTSGWHTFESESLDELAKIGKNYIEKKDISEGKEITFEGKDVILHTAGTKGSYLRMTVEQLKDLPDDVQDILLQFEITPFGRREGIIKPLRQ